MVGLVAFLINSSFSVKDADPMYWAVLGIAGSIAVVHARLSVAAGSVPGSANASPAATPDLQVPR